MTKKRVSMIPLSLVLGLSSGLAVLMGSASPAHADLKLCNKSTQPASAAIAYKNTGRNTWTAEGWWTIDPGKCVTPIKGKLSNRYYYVYGSATDDSIVWDGEHEFYVRTEEFTIVDAESKEQDDDEIRGFFEVDTADEADFTQNLLPPKK